MVKSFAHKGLEKLFYDGTERGIQPKHGMKLMLILDRLHAATRAEDMGYSGSGLHPLKGKLRGTWAVRVSGNWRITFRFHAGDAYEVNYVDYH